MQTVLVWSATIPFIRWCQRRYGDAFMTNVAPMGDVVYLGDPADIKAVFTGDPAVFHAGEGNAILGSVLGPRSVLTLDDDEHLRMRKLLLPPFHGRAIQRYADLIEEIAAREVESWPLDRPIKLHPRMQSVTLEVILRAVFGVEEGERLDALRGKLRRLVEIDTIISLVWVWPQLGSVGPWRRYRRLQAEVDALLYQEIAARRDLPDLGDRSDILSLLLVARREDGSALTDQELRDQLVTLLLAGHETTATGLAWAFERLVRTPRVVERLRAELAAGEGDEYLDAVVKETLRLRPVIADVARTLTRPTRVAGYDLPAGVTLLPAIALVQLGDAHHAEAADFRPERFLDGGASPPYTWIPFGGGTRRCLGAALATLEMKTVIRAVLERVELRPARPAPERTRVRHITQTPARGAEVVVTRRLEARREAAAAPAAATAAIS